VAKIVHQARSITVNFYILFTGIHFLSLGGDKGIA